MRAFSGQRSDSKPTNRSPAEKRRQLSELEIQLRGMGTHVAPTLRTSVERQIATLRTELGIKA